MSPSISTTVSAASTHAARCRAAPAALSDGDATEAARCFADVAVRYPALADYALYFGARAAASAGRRDDARAELRRLLADYPDTVWKSQAAFRAGALARAAGDFDEAHGWLETARAGLSAGSDRAAWATMALAEMAHRANDDVAALDLARAVRHSRPHTLADRRARRLTERIRRARPDLFAGGEPAADEAEMRFAEGDAAATSGRVGAGAVRPRAGVVLAP